MEKTFDVINLEDGIEYAIIEEIESNGNTYIYLSNVEDSEDFCIRKKIVENGQITIVGLNDDSEFDLALMLFAKNHKDVLEKISE